MNWTSKNFKLRSRSYWDLIYQSGFNLFEGYVDLVQNTSWTSETFKLRISAVDHTGIWLISLNSIYLKVRPVCFKTWVEMETPLLTSSDWLTSPWLTAAGPDNKFCKRFQTNTRSLVSLSQINESSNAHHRRDVVNFYKLEQHLYSSIHVICRTIC